MTAAPNIKPGDWIEIGEDGDLDAVVCHVSREDNAVCEAVYLDNRDRAINEEVRWTGDHWEFVKQGPCGGYADHYSRLSQYVALLRRGRYR